VPSRSRVVAALLCLAPGPAARCGEIALQGLAAGRGVAVESRDPWINGAFGRLAEGGDATGFEGMPRGDAHLGLDWSPSEVLLVWLHGTARTEPGAARGWRTGLVEAFVQYRPELTPAVALRARAGLMFPPTSRENVDPLWQSPYTLTLSAVNTWLGEEVRLGGLDVAAQLGASSRRPPGPTTVATARSTAASTPGPPASLLSAPRPRRAVSAS
jgi:hypothetical protein